MADGKAYCVSLLSGPCLLSESFSRVNRAAVMRKAPMRRTATVKRKAKAGKSSLRKNWSSARLPVKLNWLPAKYCQRAMKTTNAW